MKRTILPLVMLVAFIGITSFIVPFDKPVQKEESFIPFGEQHTITVEQDSYFATHYGFYCSSGTASQGAIIQFTTAAEIIEPMDITLFVLIVTVLAIN